MVSKVIIFIPAIEKGGVERNALWTANELAKRGYEVDIVFARSADGQLEKLNSSVHCIKLQRREIPFLNQRLVDALAVKKEFAAYLARQDKRDTIVLVFQSASIAINICKKYQIKVICRLSNHPSAVKYEKSILRKISELIKPYTYSNADQVIANSEKLSQDFGQIIHKNVVTIYNPIDFEQIENAMEEEISEDLKAEASEFKGRLLITVGRLTRQKDLQTLIRGYGKSKAKNDAMLWIVGDGDERKSIEALIKQLGLENHVHLLGYQSNVYKFLKYGDLFLQTSLYEGCPNALIEAVATGLPSIATNCLSGPSEILLNGRGGDLISIGNVDELALCIDKYFESPDILKRKEKCAQKHLERFENERVMEQYINLLNQVMEGK